MVLVDPLLTNIESFCRVRFGNGIKNKLKLLSIAVLQSFPKTIERIFGIYENIDGIIAKLWRGTVIKIRGMKYALVDFESFWIVSESERFMSMWLKPEKGEVLVDIGAHIGKYTLPMARIVGNEGLVVAIEPNPLNYQTLRKNIELNNFKNVIALNLAAWDKNGVLKLFTGHLAGHHSVKINWKLGEFKVKARTIDSILKENGICRADWIKIDVEGADWEVLCGLTATLNKYKPRIIAEVSYENIDRIKELMKEQGYGLIKIAPLFEGMIYGVFRKFAYFFLLPLNLQKPQRP